MLKIKSLQKFNEFDYSDIVQYAGNLDQVEIAYNELTSVQTLKQAVDDIRNYKNLSGKSTISATIITSTNNQQMQFRFIVSNEKVKDKIISAEMSFNTLSMMPNNQVMTGTVGRIIFRDTQKINDMPLPDLMSKIYIEIMKSYDDAKK